MTLTVCLLIVLGTLTVKLWPRTVPFDQCSDLYKQYVAVEGINATYIKDYKVNDTVFVDVTLLEAIDSTGWEILKRDFDVPVPPPRSPTVHQRGRKLDFYKTHPQTNSLRYLFRHIQR